VVFFSLLNNCLFFEWARKIMDVIPKISSSCFLPRCAGQKNTLKNNHCGSFSIKWGVVILVRLPPHKKTLLTPYYERCSLRHF